MRNLFKEDYNNEKDFMEHDYGTNHHYCVILGSQFRKRSIIRRNRFGDLDCRPQDAVCIPGMLLLNPILKSVPAEMNQNGSHYRRKAYSDFFFRKKCILYNEDIYERSECNGRS